MVEIYGRERLLWGRIAQATNLFTRFWGLMGRKNLASGEGLLIKPCNQVHTFHMRFPLDILFLSKQMQVLRVETLVPGRVSPLVREAAYVLEVSAGTAAQAGVQPGDNLTVKEQGGRV